MIVFERIGTVLLWVFCFAGGLYAINEFIHGRNPFDID